MTAFIQIKIFKNSNVSTGYCDYPCFSNRRVVLLICELLLPGKAFISKNSQFPFDSCN